MKEEKNGKECVLTEQEVRKVKKKMEKWVITWLDKNDGELFVCCPVWYWLRVKELFDWSKNGNYEIAELTEMEIRQKWRKEMKWWGREDQEGEIPVAYALPKEKDIRKMRPIVSYKKHPWKGTLNMAARLIFFMIKKVRMDETIIWKTNDLKRMVEDLNKWVKNDEEVVNFTADIKNMYTSLLHKEILKSAEWLLDLVRGKVRGSKWLSIERRGRGGGKFGKGWGAGMVDFQTTNILKLVEFDLQNCFFRLGKMILIQKEGIPMGSPLSPPLAVLTCLRYEMEIQSTLGADNRIRIKRYIDDVWFLGKFKKGDEEEKAAIVEMGRFFKNKCYHKKMSLEITAENEEVTDFLECGIQRETNGHWTCFYQSKNMIRRKKGRKSDLIRHAHFASFGSRKRTGIVMGAMARVQQNSNTEWAKILGGFHAVKDLVKAGYGKKVLMEGIRRSGWKYGGQEWSDLRRITGLFFSGGKK